MPLLRMNKITPQNHAARTWEEHALVIMLELCALNHHICLLSTSMADLDP